MSLQYTFEIENFNHGQNLSIDVRSVSFPQFSHLPAQTVGTTKKAAEQAKEISVSRSFDQSNAPLFIVKIGQSFPKAVLRVKNTKGKSYLFTLSKAYLDSYQIYERNAETSEEIKFSFDEFSMKEDSPVGDTARPKSSDKKQAAMLNFVKG